MQFLNDARFKMMIKKVSIVSTITLWSLFNLINFETNDLVISEL